MLEQSKNLSHKVSGIKVKMKIVTNKQASFMVLTTHKFTIHGNPLQYSCLENLMDRGDWQAIIHRVTKTLKLNVTLRGCLHFLYSYC